MTRLRPYRGHLVWLACLAVFFGLYFALRTNRTLMNGLCYGVLLPLEQTLAQLYSRLPLSVAELLIMSLLWTALLYAAWTVRRLVTQHGKGTIACRFVLTLALGAATVYAGFCLLWGPFYGADSFQDRSALTARGGTAAELEQLTAYFAEKVNRYSEAVPRDEEGRFAVSRNDILAFYPHAYDGAAEVYPFLALHDSAPKGFAASRALSAIQFTGFYFPFTGEANLNIDSPAYALPATLCHEMAHQRGVASEQECNFVGILAATTADNAAYNYSGWLMGYIYLHNALYRVDADACRAIRATLSAGADADLRANSRYWAQFEGPVKTVSEKVYDGFLQSNGLQDGIQNYGTVADLLLAYYLPAVAS